MGSSRTRVLLADRGRVVDVPTAELSGDGDADPVLRGAVVDAGAAGRLLARVIGPRLARADRPVVSVASPVLGGPAYRAAARAAVQVLRPHAVVTVPAARAVARSAAADLSCPLLVVDIGARLSEVVLLDDGAVVDAHHAALGTEDLDEGATPVQLASVIASMTAMTVRHDSTSAAREALRRGPLLAGGGVLRPGVVEALTERLDTSARIAAGPHTAAVRGAAALLRDPAPATRPTLGGRSAAGGFSPLPAR
nr:hypothetical protein [Streptomyces sp. HNM0574]